MRVTRPATLGLLFGLFLLNLSCESVKVEGPTGPGNNQVTVSSVSVSPIPKKLFKYAPPADRRLAISG